MNLEDLGVGTLIDIYIRRDGYNYKVVSKIEAVMGSVIAVSPIASRTKLFKFLPDDRVDLVYRKDEKMWKWQDVDTKLVIDEKGRTLHGFAVGGEAQAFNRRSTYRLNIDLVMTMKYLVRENLPDEDESLTYNKTPEIVLDNALKLLGGECFRWVECCCYLKDISEGGAALQADVCLHKGDEITFDIPSAAGMVVCKAVIVRARRESGGYFDYSYGCSFTETSRNFIRFFYELQRKQLKSSRKSDSQPEIDIPGARLRKNGSGMTE